MSWKGFFEPHILERGLYYYIDGSVTITDVSEDAIKAEVQGTELYHVSIRIDDDKVTSMECDCPYAKGGSSCKHMAATLYKFSDAEDLEEYEPYGDEPAPDEWSPEERASREDVIEELLAKIPDADKNKLLSDILARNTELFTDLKMKYDFRPDEALLSSLRSELRRINTECLFYDSPDWDNTYDLTCSLEGFLDSRVEALIDRGAAWTAFELTNEVFRTIGTVEPVGYDYSLEELAGRCYELWEKIYRKASDKEKDRIKEWFVSRHRRKRLDWTGEYFAEFIANELASKDELVKQIEELDALLTKRGNSTDCGHIVSSFGYRISVIEKRIECMRKLGASAEEIDSFCTQNKHFSAARNLLIQKALNDGDMSQAESLLLESMELDKDNEALTEEYSRQLLMIYKETGNDAAYTKELKHYLLNYSQNDMELFRELKVRMAGEAEWDSLVDRVIEKNRYSYVEYDILIEEERFSQMMDFLDESNNFYIMGKYYDLLCEKVPDRVVEFYARLAMEGMERASKRSHYQVAVSYLRNMCINDEGRLLAECIADTWKKEYPRRTALHEELREGGF